MSELLTLPKVAKLLGVGLTTLRYRVDQTAEFIPFQKQGKYKVYDESAIQIIQTINKLYESGKDIAEILPLLESQYDRQIEVQEEQAIQTINEQAPISELEKQTLLLEQIVETFVYRQDEIQQKLDSQDKRIAELENLIQQASKPWYRKFF